MMTEPWRRLSVNSSAIPRSSPPKRSFDVAFLTGVGDSSASEEEQKEDVSPVPKSSKTFIDSPVHNKRTASPSSVEDYTREIKIPFGKEDKGYGSAFTKVLKSQISNSPSSGLDSVSSLNSTWPPASTPFSAMSSLLSGSKSLSPLMTGSTFLPHALAPLLRPTSSSVSQESLVEEYIRSQNQLFSSKSSTSIKEFSPSEALSRIRSSIIPPTESYKLPFASLPYALGTVPSANKLSNPFLAQPPVSALIPSSLSTMSISAQNVCAKCNISFRMTSDLVYHMRSQHKREPDLYKKRRNEKLKCPICGESFRERHHLTRHMTAHQDREEERNDSK